MQDGKSLPIDEFLEPVEEETSNDGDEEVKESQGDDNRIVECPSNESNEMDVFDVVEDEETKVQFQDFPRVDDDKKSGEDNEDDDEADDFSFNSRREPSIVLSQSQRFEDRAAFTSPLARSSMDYDTRRSSRRNAMLTSPMHSKKKKKGRNQLAMSQQLSSSCYVRNDLAFSAIR